MALGSFLMSPLYTDYRQLEGALTHLGKETSQKHPPTHTHKYKPTPHPHTHTNQPQIASEFPFERH